MYIVISTYSFAVTTVIATTRSAPKTQVLHPTLRYRDNRLRRWTTTRHRYRPDTTNTPLSTQPPVAAVVVELVFKDVPTTTIIITAAVVANRRVLVVVVIIVVNVSLSVQLCFVVDVLLYQ